MTESTELLVFKRKKDGYKVTVKISLCICVVLTRDELKVRQNLLASDYEINILRLFAATVYWKKTPLSICTRGSSQIIRVVQVMLISGILLSEKHRKRYQLGLW